jgi:hypothetical protein
VHAEATVGGVEVGGVQQVIAQMAQEQTSREIAVERLSHKFILSYFIHFVFLLM